MSDALSQTGLLLLREFHKIAVLQSDSPAVSDSYREVMREHRDQLRKYFAAVAAQPPVQADHHVEIDALRAAVEYLDSNKLNSIDSGSMLHQQMRDALTVIDSEVKSCA